jgi:ribonuclease HI
MLGFDVALKVREDFGIWGTILYNPRSDQTERGQQTEWMSGVSTWTPRRTVEHGGSVLKKVTIYTDGACSGNPGPGGYGVVLLYNEHRKELSGGFRMTTNNRMEIMAAIAGLRALKARCNVTIVTDSQLLINTMTRGWIERWQRNGWKKRNKENVLNIDLWAELWRLCGYHKVRFVWTEGHAGDPENERCDRLARDAIGQPPLAVDHAYEKNLRRGKTYDAGNA